MCCFPRARHYSKSCKASNHHTLLKCWRYPTSYNVGSYYGQSKSTEKLEALKYQYRDTE